MCARRAPGKLLMVRLDASIAGQRLSITHHAVAQIWGTTRRITNPHGAATRLLAAAHPPSHHARHRRAVLRHRALRAAPPTGRTIVAPSRCGRTGWHPAAAKSSTAASASRCSAAHNQYGRVAAAPLLFRSPTSDVWTCNKDTKEQSFNDGRVVAIMRITDLKA
jgi:hypothetical protein